MQTPPNLYSFSDQLAKAESYAHDPVWDWLYKAYFGEDFLYMSPNIPGPSPQQNLGRDRAIMLAMGSTVTVDEKVSKYGANAMFLEHWSDRDRGKPGWICDPHKENDYLAYLWANEGVARVLPMRELRKAWVANCEDWQDRYPVRAVRSYEGSRSWTSEGVIVPVVAILEALAEQSLLVLPEELRKQAKSMVRY